MSKPLLGIVGYGAFTKLMIRYLHQDFEILVLSRDPKTQSLDGTFAFGSARSVLGLPTVVISIPAQYYSGFITENYKHFNPDGLVMDVASVKVKPVQAMLELLPKTIQVLGTHPMFGPFSAQDSLHGLKVALCPARIDKPAFDNVKSYLESKKLQLFECTPEEHDHTMAYVQGLSHYIGRIMQLMSIPETQLSTVAYDHLLSMRDVQGGDSWELFYSIVHENPYTHAVYERLNKAINDLNQKIDNQ